MIVDPNHTTQVMQVTSNTVLYSSVFTAVNKWLSQILKKNPSLFSNSWSNKTIFR